jgi:hypothetical protein
MLDHLYLSSFARYPRENELKDIGAMLAKVRDAKPAARKEAIEDLVWSMLTSKEFLFNY